MSDLISAAAALRQASRALQTTKAERDEWHRTAALLRVQLDGERADLARAEAVLDLAVDAMHAGQLPPGDLYVALQAWEAQR